MMWLNKIKTVVGMNLAAQNDTAHDLLGHHVAAVHPRTMNVTV